MATQKQIEKLRKKADKLGIKLANDLPKIIDLVESDIGFANGGQSLTKNYVNMLRNLDKTQNYSFVKVYSTDVDEEIFKPMLYEYGTIGFVRNKLGIITPVQIIPTRWGGNNEIVGCHILQARANNLIDRQHVYTPNIDIVLLYDTLNVFASTNLGSVQIPRRVLIEPLIQDMQEVLKRLGINIVLAGDKAIFNNIPKEMQEAFKEIVSEAYNSYSPFFINDGDLLQERSISTISTESRAQELFTTLKQFDQFRLNVHGLGSGTFGTDDKKANLLQSEVESTQGGIELAYQTRVDLWRSWAYKMEMVFGSKITLEFRGDYK